MTYRFIKQHEMDFEVQVMCRALGVSWDTAPMGSFWATLKTELVYRTHYRTRAEAKNTIFAYIEGWYNRQRRHSSLGYLSPEQFEPQFQA